MEEKILLKAVLSFPIRGNEVLLGIKADKIGKGCWNGYGGGVEGKETLAEAAARELEQECSLRAPLQAFRKAAIIDFHNQKSDGQSFTCRVHVYLINRWEGQPEESVEMKEPTWFRTGSLPLDGMMPADRHWLPAILAGRKIVGEFWYGPFQKSLLRPGQIRDECTLPGEFWRSLV